MKSQVNEQVIKHGLKSFGMSMNVKGFIMNNKFPRDYKGVFLTDAGRPMSPADAREMLFEELAKGRKVIPCSRECSDPCRHADNGCTGFDYGGEGCPGRYAVPADTGKTLKQPDNCVDPTS